MPDCELVVIGGGPGGYVAALRAAQLGLKVTLVEREKLGGTCLHRGCIPSKALIHGAHVWELVQRAEKFGVKLPGPPRLDYAALAAQKDKTVATLEKGVGFLLQKRGVTTLSGEAGFKDAHTLTVRGTGGQDTEVPFAHAIVATGSAPTRLPNIPIDGMTFVTSNEVLQWDGLPASIAIVGGGVIGCEFASLFARLGVPVQVVELLDGALPGFDGEVRREVEKHLKRQGIEFFFGAKVEEAYPGPTGATLVLSSGETVSAQVCVVAVGRAPHTEGLNPAAAGVALDPRGHVTADASCKTNVDHIYAIGDVTGISPFAHAASHMGLVAAERIAGSARGGRKLEFDPLKVPAGVFTKPEVGMIGLSEEKAKAGGREVKVGKFSFRALGKSQATLELDGFAKVIADAKTGELLGLHIVGEEACNLLGEGSLAWGAHANLEELAESIHCHPTLSEAVGEAALAALGRPVHGL
ncbi:MAG: dihydrolipoyl dehydrogenase [Planctomycetota bacterium]|nr:dihydrolipoyl dehydrogenase [Planctomycetota bacterium]